MNNTNHKTHDNVNVTKRHDNGTNMHIEAKNKIVLGKFVTLNSK